MPVINRASYPYITTWNWDATDAPNPNINSLRMRDSALVFNIRQFDDDEYWYIEFLHGDAFSVYPLHDLIPEGVLDQIQQGKVKLILNNSHEAYHSIIEPIYQNVIIRYKINPENVIIFTESADLDKEIEHISKKYGLTKCKAELILEFEHDAKWQVMNDNKPVTTLQHIYYEKKFVCLNGLWRPHRSAMIALLASNNLIDQGYVSFNSSHLDNVLSPEQNFDFLCDLGKNNHEFLDILKNNKEIIYQCNKLYADDPSKNKERQVYGIGDTLLYYVQNSYFTVVTETNCTNKTHEWYNTWGANTGVGRVLSEKTFKPIALKHPFVLVSVPKSLDLLKSLGYKTFSPYIDESYDKEIDDIKRFMKISDEVKRLCNLSKKELSEFLINAKKICDYNHRVLIEKTSYNHKLPLPSGH